MREIKFRAWDKEHKTMKIPNEIDFLVVKAQSINWKMQGCMSDLWLNNESESYCPIEIELMQFTGLYDKNGKEIYEGDIFEYITPISHSKYRKSVQYEESEACWILWDGNPDYQQSRLKSGLASRGVVIGNIYENPYLLKP